MSRFDDHRVHSDPSEALERDKAGPNRTVDIGSRFGMSKEAARVEMDRFRGIAEYETRKIFGQHSALKQPSAPEQTQPRTRRTNPEEHSAKSRMSANEPVTAKARAEELPTEQMEIFQRGDEASE